MQNKHVPPMWEGDSPLERGRANNNHNLIFVNPHHYPFSSRLLFSQVCNTVDELTCQTSYEMLYDQVAILILTITIITLFLLIFCFLRFATLLTSSNVKRFMRMSVRWWKTSLSFRSPKKIMKFYLTFKTSFPIYCSIKSLIAEMLSCSSAI